VNTLLLILTICWGVGLTIAAIYLAERIARNIREEIHMRKTSEEQ